MRRILLPILFFISVQDARSANVDPLAQLAQDAYTKGDYAQALALFDSLNATRNSASLLYDIGNCHIKLGDVPHAVLYYERAIRLQPGSEDIQANLDFARSQVVDRVNELPGFTLGSIWDRLRGGKEVDQWARRSLWACLLLFILSSATVIIRKRSIKRSFLFATAIMFIVTTISAGLAWYRVQEITDRSQAIIMMPKVDVLGEPRTGSTTLFVLHEGTKVTVLQTQGGWYEVKLNSGTVGWAPPSALVVI